MLRSPRAARPSLVVLSLLGAVTLSLVLLARPARGSPSTPEAQIGEPAQLDLPPLLPDFLGCGGVNPAPVNAAYEQQVVELVNAQRQVNGSLPPLKRVAELDSAARYHSQDMVQDNYFQHDSYDRVAGALIFACGFGERVGAYYAGWQTLAENIAAGYGTPQAVMDIWMASSGHRANILSTSLWEIGIGYASGATYGHYWTQDFGRRRTAYPLVINREAAVTSSPNVQLYVYDTWAEIRLRNENGGFGPWQPFTNNLSWTLSPGPAGPRTVYAEMRNGTRTASASDEIFLNAAAPTPTPGSTTRGDCNGDRLVNAADLSALPLEIFDGDGNLAVNVPGGTFAGNPIGCDANADTLVNAADLSCTVLLIFEGPGACR
jgi:uncharacterized protein YkwD